MSLSYEELEQKIKRAYEDYCHHYSQDIFFTLKAYRVKNITQVLPNVVAAILAYYINGINTFASGMLAFLLGKETINTNVLIMTLHKLGNLKVLLALRDENSFRYHYRLDPNFLDHIKKFCPKLLPTVNSE